MVPVWVPSPTVSLRAVTVTVCAAFQLAVVKVSVVVLRLTWPLVSSSVMVTSAVGALSRTTV